jgi:hypothetical protein
MLNYGSNMKKTLEKTVQRRDWRVNSGENSSMRRKTLCITTIFSILAVLASLLLTLVPALVAQTPEPAYKPKFPGDPARSDSEAAALAYMRVVLRAQRQFNKQYDHFATSLSELVHSGSFTKRMVNPDRGDYTVDFKGKKDNFVLAMMPKQLDATHRSFYAEDDSKIHADEEKPADPSSPVVK